MTNNPTIDGVSRDTIQRAIDVIQQVGYQDKFIDYDLTRNVQIELRALLDAPAVERQDRTAHSMKSVAEAVDASRCYTVLTSNQCYALAQSLNNQAVRVSAAVERQPAAFLYETAMKCTENSEGRVYSGFLPSLGVSLPSVPEDSLRNIRPLYEAAPEVAALQSTIARLEARIADLESGPKAAEWHDVAGDDEGLAQ